MPTAVVLNLCIQTPLHRNTFRDPTMYYNYTIQDEYLKICWALAEKPRLRTAALFACSMNRNKQTHYQFSHLLNIKQGAVSCSRTLTHNLWEEQGIALGTKQCDLLVLSQIGQQPNMQWSNPLTILSVLLFPLTHMLPHVSFTFETRCHLKFEGF